MLLWLVQPQCHYLLLKHGLLFFMHLGGHTSTKWPQKICSRLANKTIVHIFPYIERYDFCKCFLTSKMNELCCALYWFGYTAILNEWIHLKNLPIFFSATEVIMKDMDNINLYQNRPKHNKTWARCSITERYCIIYINTGFLYRKVAMVW